MRGHTKVLFVTVVLAVPALIPAVAQATMEAGHPELYENGVRIPGKNGALATMVPGQVHLESAQLGSEGLECMVFAFGELWNEGTPLRGVGQLEAWHAQGHVPEGTHTKLSSSCRPEVAGKAGSFVTSEGWIKSESNPSHEVETALRRHSTPWNVETRCGVRSEEYVTIVKVGVPTSEFPKSATACPEEELLPTAQAEEVAAYKAEREEHKGCYTTNPAPEGCVRVTFVEPGAGLEFAYGGTQWLHMINGVHNGLTASKWKLEGATSGELQCEFPAGCTATQIWTGEVKVAGSRFLTLVTAK